MPIFIFFTAISTFSWNIRLCFELYNFFLTLRMSNETWKSVFQSSLQSPSSRCLFKIEGAFLWHCSSDYTRRSCNTSKNRCLDIQIWIERSPFWITVFKKANHSIILNYVAPLPSQFLSCRNDSSIVVIFCFRLFWYQYSIWKRHINLNQIYLSLTPSSIK